MTAQNDNDLKPMPEQLAYANLLFIGAWLGIALMIVTYFIYIGGIFPSHVDISVITQNWDKGTDEFLKIIDGPHGWGWTALLNKGDFLNYVGLVFIATLTIICYIFLIVGYGKIKDWAFFVICIIEVLVLTVAASGILGSGGH